MTQPPIVPEVPPPPRPEQPTTVPPMAPDPGPYGQPMIYYGPPPVPQIVTKPGGMSGAAHAVHILIALFTCGLWLIPYAIIVALQPARRFEVIVPVGADPAAVQAAYAQVAAATQPRQQGPSRMAARRRETTPQRETRRAVIMLAVIVPAIIGIAVVLTVLSMP